MKYLILALFTSLSINAGFAIPPYHFEYYSTDDGLPQHTVMDILQDTKGFMWFVTWDGLCKFDGNTFTSYKIYPEDAYYMKNSRIDNIYEDKYGYLWLQSYDGEPHRFDPRTKIFQGLQTLTEYDSFSFDGSKLRLMPSGKTWILSDKTGCICVSDSLFATEVFNSKNGKLKGNCVYEVFEDKSENSWILTDNGLVRIATYSDTPETFFTEQDTDRQRERQSFFCAVEWNGYIWFGSNNGRIWRYNKDTKSFTLLNTSATSHIIHIENISPDEVLIVTAQDGLLIHNLKTEQNEVFNYKTVQGMPDSKILSCYTDNHQTLWLETELSGVSRFDFRNRTFKHFRVADINYDVYPPNFFIFEDTNDQLWVHPKSGGFSLYNRAEDKLEQPFNNDLFPENQFSNMFHAAYTDRQGNLWLSPRSQKLVKVVFDSNAFAIQLLDSGKRLPSSNDVRAVFEDNDLNRWIAAKDGKIRVFDQSGTLSGILCKDGKVGSGTPVDGVAYCIMQGSNGDIWIGSRGEGIYRLQKKNDAPLAFSITQYKGDENDVYSLSSNSIYSMIEDSKGRLWIGTFGGGINMLDLSAEGKPRFINHRNHLKNYPMKDANRVRFITETARGNICVGTTGGLVMFKNDFSTPENIEYKHYLRIAGDIESLSNNNIHYIKNTRDGELYIATFGGGVNLVTEYDNDGFPTRFKSYTKRQGMIADIALAIEEDKQGMLWITSENSLTRFDPKTEAIETFGEIKRLMRDNNFSEASACCLRDGKIMIGYSEGVLSFYPDKIKNNTYQPYIALTRFSLFNQEVNVDSKSILTQSLDDTKNLTLKHNQNFFSIEYAALDFVDPKNVRYAYKLEGFDNDWIYAQNQRTANYTNIPKGDYVFKVRSTNSDGIWTENERTLPVKVLPSFWETPWAYLAYVLLFFLLVFVSVRILVIIYRLKDNVKLEHQLAEIKLRFFTDISHEIRTPLTMITAPLEFLLQNKRISSDVRYHLELMQNNTNRILRLVNQILDFRKMQHHKMEFEEVEIAPFIEEICEHFKKTAIDKKIDFRFVNNIGYKMLSTDKDAVEKILFNLLSNAVKYTPSGQSVTVRLYQGTKNICLEVKDTGIGISKEKQKNLFIRFASFNEDKSNPSTGIGLSMVKELIDKLGAAIAVESEPEKGSTFTVYFAEQRKGASTAESKGEKQKEQTPESTPAEIENVPTMEEKKNAIPVVLIVEDDNDLRTFLRTMLEKKYTIHEAVDGEEGLEKALQIIPDFIISDIMMPRMDGVELLKKLRKNINTSHIPIILLTAKTTIENRIAGLEHGADDYITKPFSVPYFKARVENLLRQRKHLQEIYCSISDKPNADYEPERPKIISQDEIFMEKVIKEIENNIENSNFIIDDLATTVGMSRTVFFKKIKGLTGCAPVEFVRDMRLKRSRQLLETGEMSVKEVAFMVGITDPSYFRKCFKEKFGVNPAEYKNKAT